MKTEKKIVYIDGERRYRNKVKIIFAVGTYRCLLCSNGKEGLAKIVDENPDVVIVDYSLPDISGEELYTRFLTESRFRSVRNIPFIVLTNNGKVDKSKLYSLGFSGCLSKPFRTWELKEFVDDVIVTHQLKMEEIHYWETIREAKDFLERVVESSADAIITTDASGIITYCNRASEEMLGYGFEEMIGKRVSHFLKKKSSELMKIASMLNNCDKVQDYKTVVVKKDETEVPIDLSISKMKNRDGKVIGALGIGKRISKDKYIKNETNELDLLAAVEETAVAVNHAINNPLVPILGNAQYLLKDENLLDEDVRRRLKVIVNNAQRIREVTRKLTRIRHPVTKEYLEGTRMLDIEASVQL